MIFYCQTVQQARKVKRAFASIEHIDRANGTSTDIEVKPAGVWVEDKTGDLVFCGHGSNGIRVEAIGEREYIDVRMSDDDYASISRIRMYPDDEGSYLKVYVS